MAFSASSSAKSFPRGGKDVQSHSRDALVIEDNPGLIDLLVIILEFGGYTASLVSDAEAALTWIDHAFYAATIPTIILLDLDTQLGMERSLFLNQLRERWQKMANAHPPLIVLKTLVHDLNKIEYQVL
jgi:CheY-like chemotaxis protein